jgi:transposase
MNGKDCYLVIKAKRGICEKCDDHPTTNQRLDWYDYKSRHTKAYLQHLLLSLVNSTLEDVATKEKVSADTLERALQQSVSEKVDWARFKTLDLIGVDEISVKKGYKNYRTIITSKPSQKVRILAVLEGRKKATVKEFFKSIPPKLKGTIQGVCCDMYDGYIYAILEALKGVPVIIDRFHVAKLYRKCLVKLRQSELSRLRKTLTSKTYKSLKTAIAILRRNTEVVKKEERKELEILFNHSPKLRAGYRLCRSITSIYNSKFGHKRALRGFKEWEDKVAQSDLLCFDGFVQTLTRYQEHIVNYFKGRHTSGFVEGFNNKIKTMKRRCYGISNEKSLFRRLFLDTEGYDVFLSR